MSIIMTGVRPAAPPVRGMSAKPSVCGGRREPFGDPTIEQSAGTLGADRIIATRTCHDAGVAGLGYGRIAPLLDARDHRDRADDRFRSIPTTSPTITSVSGPSSRSRAPSIG